jgi:hypothetical protein
MIANHSYFPPLWIKRDFSNVTQAFKFTITIINFSKEPLTSSPISN